MISQWLSKLQKQPYKVRIRILWITVLIVAFILIVLWFSSLKQKIANLNTKNLLASPEQQTLEESGRYVSAERIETSPSGSSKLFFKINNPTDDILNLPKIDGIKLEVDNQTINPLKIYDRQNHPFVSKVLSHTENFGILIFSELNAQKANLIFKDLYFEQHPEVIFNEKLELDLDKLKKIQELRK